MHVQSLRVLGLVVIAATFAGCDTSTSYRQEIEFAPGEIGVAEISMDLRRNCAWGQSCGVYDYNWTRLTIRLVEPEGLRDIEWTGPDHSPAFLGRIDGEMYLALLAKQCFGGDGFAAVPAHPVFRWTDGQWTRVPHESIPSGTRANIFYVMATTQHDGKIFPADEVRERIDLQREGKSVYSRAAAELDFDRWYKLIFGRCAGSHDRY
jgi:hypothetical protein